MSSAPIIFTTNLSKHFQVPVREAGLRAATKSLVKRTYRSIKAVDEITFEIQPGEVVGFLGPNGAGKTTTLKMLSGLLFPTSGEVKVLGYQPDRRQADFLRQITLVMGNRNQLAWDLPAMDSFDLARAIYSIPETDFKKTWDEFIEILSVEELVTKPIRNLSLGERMKMEIIGLLLHKPKVLFLDEPTIGLDVTMQRRIRQFVREYNLRTGATVLLTSHYMADMEALCKRLIVIHQGRLLFDGALESLVKKFSAFKTIGVTLADHDLSSSEREDLSVFGEVIRQEGSQVLLKVPKAETAQVTARLLSSLNIDDLTVEDPPIEDVIESVFNQ